MMGNRCGRRAGLLAAGLLSLGLAVLAAGSAVAQSLQTGMVPDAFPPLPGGRFGDVRVDVRPLLARSAGLEAAALHADLTEALRRTFRDRIGGPGPILVVRITALSLREYVGSSSRSFGGGMQNDYLEGEALLVDRRGAVLGRHTQLTATPSSFGGAWYEPGSERRRVAAIAEIYAQWLRRDLPLN
ncbi:hypothetical protein [Methylobacterium symbioticum]|uniref:DUF4136 domain-containing protein n=2 Tax=Methylobacterium TaxID=407 RepID=A0A509EAZ3_9HYPH|nr:hypothetical protein MET9862_01298 [Methylobacterium symbioticum]